MKTLYDNLNVLPSITIHRMPSSCRATLAEKAAFTGRETFVLNKGKIYAPSGNTKKTSRTYTDPEVQALVALGVFTKAQQAKLDAILGNMTKERAS